MITIRALAHRAGDFTADELASASWRVAKERPFLATIDGEAHAQVVESYIWQGDTEVIDRVDGSQTVLAKGDWVVGLRLSDEAFARYEAGDIFGIAKEWNEDAIERDENGRFSSGGGGSSSGSNSVMKTPPVTIGQPGVWQSKYPAPGAIPYVAQGKEDYIKAHGFPVRDIDYLQIAADPEKGTEVAKAYDALPSYSDDPHTVEAYTALRDEVKEQFDYMTNVMGIEVDVTKDDPYKSVYELQKDLTENNHISVLATSETGGHPFFTNEENDMFRAVHDTFGHMGGGTGFDRNGEEAAFVSHFQMFSPLASEALATETRGQNSWLTYMGNGEFAEQKFAILPKEFSRPYLNEGMQVVKSILDEQFLHDDEARNLALFGTVNPSLGRRLPVKASVTNEVMFDIAESLEKEWNEDNVERDEMGRFASSGSGGTVTVMNSRALASPIVSRAEKIEPKLTNDLQQAAKIAGGQLAGLQFRLKSEGSLMRKIQSDAQDKYPGDPKGLEKAAKEISDANRYTMVAPQDSYTEMVQNALSHMSDLGYDVDRTKNYWVEGNNYKGINVAMVSGEGDRVELQFHTPESLNLKESVQHPLYEAYREIEDSGSAEAQALNNQMISNASSLVTPPGVESIGTMKVMKTKEVLTWM
jgi:hypothetical protein